MTQTTIPKPQTPWAVTICSDSINILTSAGVVVGVRVFVGVVVGVVVGVRVFVGVVVGVVVADGVRGINNI